MAALLGSVKDLEMADKMVALMAGEMVGEMAENLVAS